ncbi:unnamed protein product [Prorocentrum cordatum]|uniref:Uncharacterized protein n=1 Tax=Prorocentrum cordatum TaxID=2364126 RepID=A0ABN9QUB7_9DINO|nr:unnamed protein product [Polarella glacialis]
MIWRSPVAAGAAAARSGHASPLGAAGAAARSCTIGTQTEDAGGSSGDEAQALPERLHAQRGPLAQRFGRALRVPDIMLYAQSADDLENMLELLMEELAAVGLHLDPDKTKVVTAEETAGAMFIEVENNMLKVMSDMVERTGQGESGGRDMKVRGSREAGPKGQYGPGGRNRKAQGYLERSLAEREDGGGESELLEEDAAPVEAVLGDADAPRCGHKGRSRRIWLRSELLQLRGLGSEPLVVGAGGSAAAVLFRTALRADLGEGGAH